MHHCSRWWASRSRNISRIHGMLYRDLKRNLNNGWPVIGALLLCLAKNRLKWPQKRECNVLIDFMSRSLVKTGIQKPTWASFSLTKEFTIRLWVCVCVCEGGVLLEPEISAARPLERSGLGNRKTCCTLSTSSVSAPCSHCLTFSPST